MTVSVVIPCYNQGEFLADAIGSVQSQSARPTEIIVVDDGSTDHTPEIAQSFGGVRYLRQDNRGLSEARNTGFRASRGEFLLFLDSDDRLPPDAIENHLTTLKDAEHAALSYGRLRRISTDGESVGERKEPVRTAFYHDLLQDNYIPTPGMALFRREVLDEIGLFDPTVPATADYDIYLRITRRRPIVGHQAISVERRFHPRAMTRGASRMLRQVLRVHQRQWPHVKSDPTLRDAYRAGRRWWQRWYGDQLAVQISVERHLRSWARLMSDSRYLLRHRPQRIRDVLRPPRCSNVLHFGVEPNQSNRVASVDPKNPGPDELTIESVELGGYPDMCGDAAGSTGALLATITCRNARNGTVAFLDDAPLASVMLTPARMQALIPASSLSNADRRPMFLVG